MTIFYHPGKAGEVSHEAAAAYVAKVMANPFSRSTGLLEVIANRGPAGTRRNIARGRALCAPGAMNTYLQAAAVRDATRGES